MAYRGEKSNSQWVDVDRRMQSLISAVREITPLHSDLYSNICAIRADFRSAVEALPCLTGTDGTTYFKFHFTVEMFFGLTEHKAQICWKENVRPSIATSKDNALILFRLQGEEKRCVINPISIPSHNHRDAEDRQQSSTIPDPQRTESVGSYYNDIRSHLLCEPVNNISEHMFTMPTPIENMRCVTIP